MKKTLFSMAAAFFILVLFNSFVYADDELAAPEYLEISGRYSDGTTGFVYNDEMMLESSYEMSGDLAKMSVALACAAYDQQNVCSMLSDMGYTVDGVCGPYYYDVTRTLEDNDFVAFTIGKKPLDDGRILYIAAIRGTPGGDEYNKGYEWFSDFNIGDPETNGGNHTGFYRAADRVAYALNGIFASDGADA